MATRSTITYKGEIDGKTGYHTIYTHWDGYPSYRFPLLEKHYSDEEKVKNLIRLGDVSSLAESIEKPDGHTFDHPVDKHTVFYGRDRNETGIDANFSETLNEAFASKDGLWHYLFDGETKEWWIYEGWCNDGYKLTPLTLEEALKVEDGV